MFRQKAFDKFFELYDDIEPIKLQASTEARLKARKLRMGIFKENLKEIKDHNSR